jgi:hypothetical protein
MRGPCAYIKCSVGAGEEVNVADCTVCRKSVHHMCSNELLDGELSVRVCSVVCAVQVTRSSAVAPYKARITQLPAAPISGSSGREGEWRRRSVSSSSTTDHERYISRCAAQTLL